MDLELLDTGAQMFCDIPQVLRLGRECDWYQDTPDEFASQQKDCYR